MNPLKVLFATRQNSAVGYYRHWVPARLMREAGHEVVVHENGRFRDWAKPDFPSWCREHQGQFDIVFSDRVNTIEDLSALRTLTTGGRLVVDHDDNYRDIPPWNPAVKAFRPGQEARRLADLTLRAAELNTFSTEALAEVLGKDSRAYTIYHNHIDPQDWVGHPTCPDRPHDSALRIFYGGAAGHYGDVDVMREALENFLRTYNKPVRLIVFGTATQWMHELHRWKPGLAVVQAWVPFVDYPKAVAWGGFDMAVVPLANHPFNTCKSTIKALETAIQGIPTIISKVPPYDQLPTDSFLRVDNTFEDWSEALELLAGDRGLRETLRSRAQEWVKEWYPEHGRQEWERVLERIMDQTPILDPADI